MRIAADSWILNESGLAPYDTAFAWRHETRARKNAGIRPPGGQNSLSPGRREFG
jgi:hypothetical protein